jgi:hypothetical protein
MSIVFIILSVICSSCATQLNTSKQDLEQLKPSEGIVFGSALVKNDLKNEKKSWGGLLSPLTKIKTTEFNYRLFIHKRNFLMEPNFNLDLELNKEKYFIYKFEDGEYCIKELIPITKSSFPFGAMLRIPVGSCFVVSGGITSYIGKLIVSIPENIQTGSGVLVQVTDEKSDSISELEKEQKINLRNSITNLIH